MNAFKLQIPEIPEEEKTPAVIQLLEFTVNSRGKLPLIPAQSYQKLRTKVTTEPEQSQRQKTDDS